MLECSGSKAERCLLSAMMQRTIKPSQSGLSPADFSEERHGRIYAAALEMERRGDEVDMVSLADTVGMDELLIDIAQEEGFSASLAAKHAQIVRENAMRRAVSRVLLEASRALNTPDASASGVCLKAIDELREVIAGGTTVKTRNMLELAQDALAALKNPQLQPTCVTTGVRTLDALLGGSGMKPSNLVIVGARPGVGKSALMLSMALSAAEEGRKVLYISLEMSDEENAQRALTNVTGMVLTRLASGEEMTGGVTIDDTLRACRLDNIEHYAASICRVSEIRNLAAQLRDKQGLDMVCVDYIGLLRPEQSLGNRVNEISQITRDLKALAMEMNIVVMAASQLNRDNTKTNRRPQLSDLRESGSIEQDANVVVFIHDDGNGADEFGSRKVELILAKNRQGQKGGIHALFRGGVMRFAEVR